MTDPVEEQPKATPRRPPAAPAEWATVTPLGALRRDVEHSPRPGAAPGVSGSLALAVPAAPLSSRSGRTAPELRLLPGGDTGDRPGAGGDEVKVWAGRFAQAVVEVLGGDRPLAQLVRWTSQRVYLELERRLAILHRTQDAGRRMRTVRPQVRSVHVFHPTPHSAEVSVHVRHGQRSRAIAARLELVRGRWQCTALLLG